MLFPAYDFVVVEFGENLPLRWNLAVLVELRLETLCNSAVKPEAVNDGNSSADICG